MAASNNHLRSWSQANISSPSELTAWLIDEDLIPDAWLAPSQSVNERLALVHKNIFFKHSWRMTSGGTKLLMKIFQPYQFTHADNQITGRLLLGGDAAIVSPWYIYSSNKLVIFDVALSFELQMFDGSMMQWLSFKNQP